MSRAFLMVGSIAAVLLAGSPTLAQTRTGGLNPGDNATSSDTPKSVFEAPSQRSSTSPSGRATSQPATSGRAAPASAAGPSSAGPDAGKGAGGGATPAAPPASAPGGPTPDGKTSGG